MTRLLKYLTDMKTHRFYSIVPVAILIFCAALNVSVSAVSLCHYTAQFKVYAALLFAVIFLKLYICFH
jgi:hypothetical protein